MQEALISKTVKVRELLFQFASMEDWIKTAQGMFRAHGHTCETAICIDLNGTICTRGLHFKTARYPVSVYAIDDPPYEPSGMIGKRQRAAPSDDEPVETDPAQNDVKK